MTSTTPPSPPGLLVEPAWLDGMLGSEGTQVVDMRPRSAHAEGHIPGAVQLDLERLGTRLRGCENVLLPPDAFEALMAELGVRNGGTVIAYDDQWGLAAARLVWALHFYGHGAAAALDGGWDRWKEEGRPVSDDPTPPSHGDFRARVNGRVAADFEWLAARVADGGVRLVDTRMPAEYADGHLPGAVCWDWFNAVPPDSWNAVRDPEELRREWEGMGIASSDEVVVYCRSGMRAAHTWMALRHAGYRRVRLYDGSWQEWSAAGGERG